MKHMEPSRLSLGTTLLLAAGLTFTGLAATGASAGEAEISAEHTQIDAKALYDNGCASCHAADGKGNTRLGRRLQAKDYTDPKVTAAMKDDEAFKSIREGLSNAAGRELMQPYDKLSDAEIKALIAHMRSFSKSN